MSVRLKTLLIIFSTLACLIVVMFGISRVIIAGSYQNLEAQTVRENIRRAQNAINDQTTALDSVCRDLALRPDTSSFLQSQGQKYIDSTLNTQFFSDFKVSFALFFDQSGNLVYGQGFDVGSGRMVPLNASLSNPGTNAYLLQLFTNSSKATSGLVMLPESPAIVSTHIIPGIIPGTSIGSVILGNYLDSTRIKDIAANTYVYHLNIFQLSKDSSDPNLATAARVLDTGVPINVSPIDEDYVAGYMYLTDINCKPALILKVDQPRTIYDQGLTTMGYFNYAVIGTGIVFAIIIMLMMEKQVLFRLSFLRKRVSTIDLDSDQHTRIAMRGKDEFSGLSATIDGMLLRLENSFNAVRLSEKKYRSVLESIEEGYFEMDTDGRFLVVNDALCSILGRSRQELVNTEPSKYLAGDDVTRFTDAFAQIRRTGEPARWQACQAVKPDGSVSSIEISAYPILDEQTNNVGFRGIARDVTDRKRQEQKLLVTSKLASIGELASGVAHELNNPLTSVTGYAQLLSANQGVSPEIKADLDKIYRESQRAAKIVHNLLSFARQRKPQKEAGSINDVIKQTLELRAYEHKMNGISVKLNLNQELPPAMIDSNQIQQVLLNLIVNAEHAIAESGRSGTITITTKTTSAFVQTIISDNGCGIAPENLARIFDPFFTTKDVNQGTGLGLSICHGIVSEHGGRLYAESVRGQGASFYLELPVATQGIAAESVNRAPAIVQPALVPTKASILVIDDEPAIREVLKRNLSSKGYRIGTAADGKAGLSEIARDGYDLCLIDLQMPEMNGREIFDAIKSRYPGYVEKVIFVTGDTVSQSTHRYLQSTGRPFLAKPFSYLELVEKIEGTLPKIKKEN